MSNPPLTELEHVREVQGLFVKHSSRIRGYVASLVPGRPEVDDLVQEVFLVVTAKAGDFEQGSNFVAWAMTIARFKVLEFFRAGKKKEALLGDDVLEMLIDEGPVELGENRKMEALRVCLKTLSPRVQRMLADRYDGGLKPERIAEKSGWKANSVYVTLSRARSSLRQCIERKVERGTV
ncbi:MAG: sigma-70 family RNA polymerase sigma factor [Akkermansiaceae bacterium]